MTGGIIAKKLIKKPIREKITVALAIQIILVLFMIFTAPTISNIYTLIGFTIGIHTCGGFIFNIIFAYCLSRFTKNAGMASGITGGVMYMISSTFSYALANLYAIKSQMSLGIAYASLIAVMALLFILFDKTRQRI